MSSNGPMPTNELELLTADNKPAGTICLLQGKLYVQLGADKGLTQPAKFLKNYVEGDYFDVEGIPGYAAYGQLPGNTQERKSKNYFTKCWQALHGGRKFSKS